MAQHGDMWEKVGRNDPCPCGSGLRFKKCCAMKEGIVSGGGVALTTLWAPGTLMRTQASFRAPATVPDGRYRLIAGLFRG